MTSTLPLRVSITGLLGATAVEEELLLAGLPPGATEQGGPQCWAAAPLIAHNTEFKRQQVTRLTAIRQGLTPPDFAEIDHRSAEVYRSYCQQDAGQVRQASREVTAALIDELAGVSDADLLEARHPWLRGRKLWLQVVVRGFWHPMGHIADYHIGHGLAGRAVEIQAHTVTTANYLTVPDPARGMAYYSLACAEARAQLPGDALDDLRQAVRLNPELAGKIATEPDLAGLRTSGQLDELSAG